VSAVFAGLTTMRTPALLLLATAACSVEIDADVSTVAFVSPAP
jgi:hypothetical protein